MKTDELVALLATHAGPAAPGAVSRFALATGWGAFGAVLLMALQLGVRDDLGSTSLLPMFWVKLAFPLSLAVGALALCERAGRPGARFGRVPLALAAPVAVMWLLAAVTLWRAGAGERATLVFGDSWTNCLVNVGMLSLPMFAAALWALRGLAPVRPALAGGAAGLLAGAVGAAAYALHCPEMAAPFLGIWYVAGMLIPALAGAALGPLLLRW